MADFNSVDDLIDDFVYDVSQNINNLDFFNKPVESDVQASETASSEASLIFIVPPVLKVGPNKILNEIVAGGVKIDGTNLGDVASLLGAVQMFSTSESKMGVQINEVGSKIKRDVPGKTQYRVDISRLRTKAGGNLKGSMYKWINKVIKADSTFKFDRTPSANVSDTGTLLSNHFSGLESEIYKVHFGLMMVYATSLGKVIGTSYYERCTVSNFGRTISASNPPIIGNISINCNRIIPLRGDSGSAVITNLAAKSNLVKGSDNTQYKFSV